MLKKQIQKSIIYSIFLIAIVAMQLGVLFIPKTLNKASAAYEPKCTYNDDTSNNFFLDHRRDSTVSILKVTPVKSGDLNLGFSADIVITYAAPTAANEYTNQCTAAELAPSIQVARSATRLTAYKYYTSAPIPLTGVTVEPQADRSLKVQGKINIPDLASAIPVPTNTLDYVNIRNIVNWDDPNSNFALLVDTFEGGSGLNGILYRYYPELPIKLVGCVNKTKICTQLDENDNTPASADAINIELKKIAFGLKVASPNKDLVAKNQRDSDTQNFFRVYIDSTTRKVVDLPLNAQVRGVSPQDKILKIKSSGQTSNAMLPTIPGSPTQFSPKPILGLGVGMYNEKIKYSSRQSIGCVPETLSTSAAIGTNSTVAYEWCNLDPAQKKDTNVTLKMDGSQSIPYNITIADQNLKNLFLTIDPLQCPSGKCPDETQDKAYVASVVSVLDLDQAILSDTTLIGFGQSAGAWTIRAMMNAWAGLPISFRPATKIYIMVYPDKASWEAAKDKDAPDWVPEPTETIGEAQIKSDSVSQTLYAFIVRVISDLIVWLQSVIYRIFAYIVAPILNALLRVRPYQDAFVNVIYPGWLILRNLANIFFIVSLLVVGLRILFQQSAATAARGFIMRLIIMALLVNFSLVIGQGIIGIADTVQSQFLPGETRIIEALGHKLMVEPLKNFRAEVTNSESGVFDSRTAESGLSDTVKPIVLLILSIASFFAFVAIAAFLTVRLVALWVLYMLSPIAYVGFVMDETQQYARKWWDEFIKYAIVTPVLVFFLNIAALMAMSFSSGNSNSLFKFSDGSLAGDIVVGSLTILTHFIVLFFIFAGMKFALSSGTSGSKSIVKYAKKGFDAVTTRPAKWAAGAAAKAIPGAKDFVGDQASTGMGKLFGKRAENITQALFKPLDAAKKLKQGAWDRPGEDRKKRSEKRLKTIDDQSYKIMNNKWKSAKYAASTLAGQGPKRKLREGERKIDESQILTDDEKTQLKADLASEEAKKKAHAERLRLLKEKGVIDADKVTDIEKGIDQSIIELDDEDAELEKKYDKYTKSGDTKRADAVAVQRKDIADRKGDLEAIKDAIFNAKSITLDGSVEIKEVKSDLVGKGAGGEDVKLTAVFDPDAYKAMLEKEGKDIEAEESRLNKRAEEDERRRKDYPNRVTMDLPTRAMLEKQGMEIQEEANKRFLPTSLAERASRVADEREESKKLEDVDDADELTEMFGDAMRKNNMALATAISKKLAKEGNFDKLLNANGYENNLKSFQAFMDKHFKNMAPQARYQIASEVGHLASQNGNTTFVKPTKVQGGVMRWSTPEEHAEVKSANIEKASSYDLAKKKKWELGYQRNGKSYLDKTTIDSLNNMPKEKLKKMTERTSAKFIKDLVKFANYHELAGHVQETLESKK